jgi:hypothetical protein
MLKMTALAGDAPKTLHQKKSRNKAGVCPKAISADTVPMQTAAEVEARGRVLPPQFGRQRFLTFYSGKNESLLSRYEQYEYFDLVQHDETG